MENLSKGIKVRLVNNVGDYKKWVSRPSFISQKIFNKTFVPIHEIKPVLTLDNSIYVGCETLDFSKYLMYEFNYKYIKQKCNTYLLFTDNDSLVHEIETKYIYENFYENKSLFDFSDYPELFRRFFDPVNKKVIGKMKNEFKGNIIREFIGLKSKMYSLVTIDYEEIEKAKEVNKTVVKNIKHREYIDVLFNKKMIRHKMRRIQSKLHKNGIFDVYKIYLSCFNDKRYVLGDGINSLAYFHKDIRSQ